MSLNNPAQKFLRPTYNPLVVQRATRDAVAVDFDLRIVQTEANVDEEPE
jgi:hypothetical protein